jgi:hypothetical protein
MIGPTESPAELVAAQRGLIALASRAKRSLKLQRMPCVSKCGAIIRDASLWPSAVEPPRDPL